MSADDKPDTDTAAEAGSPAVETDAVETDTHADTAEPAPPTRTRRTTRVSITAIVLAVALVASAALTGWLYFTQYRPDQQISQAVSDSVLTTAKDGTVALLSYSPDSLEQDFTAAKSRLTGDFLSYYTQFTQDIVTPAAKQKSVKTTAAVVRAAVSQLTPGSAEVLVFINQNTTSAENPEGAFAMSAVRVGLTRINGAWLISSFDPV
ncbi:twin-arginine translocation pathway signal [Mycolicibacterium baixiangningiae]|uniref:twin-arginine translocation pathway signal n=1 Tax=Mycolicibacterium baixiangningiae TaxID=2761578 RepID=UPI0018675D0D|nr:twin-arginine translocation pathway signal [Mycolicibacterium baixiangningiae]